MVIEILTSVPSDISYFSLRNWIPSAINLVSNLVKILVFTKNNVKLFFTFERQYLW